MKTPPCDEEMSDLVMRNTKEVFESAIEQGMAPENYMYMYSTADRDFFKHKDTREYISFENTH